MSEFSESYHIKTTNAPEIERRLAAADLGGYVYGPKNGWLTFIPYFHHEAYDRREPVYSFSKKLHNAAESPVLEYVYAEDHLWYFAVVTAERPPLVFSYVWDGPPELEITFEPGDLEGVLSYGTIKPYLIEERGPWEAPIAYAFAEAVGLPRYKWLSPDYLERHGEESALNEGWRQIGDKTPDPADAFPLPDWIEASDIDPDISAREALAHLTPLLSEVGDDWALTHVNGSSHHIAEDNLPNSRSWSFYFFSPTKNVRLEGFVVPNGMIGLRYAGEPHPKDPPIFTLSDTWIDSRQASDTARSVPKPERFPEAKLVGLDLFAKEDEAEFWAAIYSHGQQVRTKEIEQSEFLLWKVYMVAWSGDVVYQTLSSREHSSSTVRPTHHKIGDEPWTDIEEPVDQ
ncbi:MAG: hypothetical protein AAGM38_12020 [Pseudomonadota bacterium]